MDDDLIKTIDKKFVCSECQNEIIIEGEHKPGDVIECEFCGLEYEIVGNDDGEFTLRIIEEEK